MLFAQMTNDFLPEYQAYLFEMLKDLICIMDLNNLTWWVDGGTLLGLIRGGGFIPWDDDVDISMPRSDYNKLLETLKHNKAFLEKYSVEQTASRAKEWQCTKVYSGKYLLFEDLENQKCFVHRAFIDIFAYDSSNGSVLVSYCRKKMLRNYGRINAAPKNASLITFLVRLRSHLVLKLATCMYKLINLFTRHDIIYLKRCIYSAVHHSADVLPTQEVKWDGIKVKVPNNYRQYLINLFGESYMQLPPPEKQRSHAVLIVRNF